MTGKNDAIWKRAQLLAKHFDKSDIQGMTLLVLYDLEIPINYSGFDYLKNVVPVALKRPSRVVLTELFRDVGETYCPPVDYETMDTAVREVIKKAWKESHGDRWDHYFPDYILRRNKPPSNAEFVSAMVYFLEIWLGRCKEGEHAGK